MNVRVIIKSFLQMGATTFGVMLFVIFLLGKIPDYATFEGEDRFAEAEVGTLETESYWNRNVKFWYDLVFADGGASRTHRDQTVGSILRRDIGISCALLSISLLVSVVFGGLLGLWSAWARFRFFTRFLRLLGLLFTSIPSFLLVPLLVYIFVLRLDLLPAALWQGPQSLILPVVTLSVRPIFYLARVFERQLLTVASRDFVRMARAKGLRRNYIWLMHIAPNALSAFIVGSGNLFGQLITGSFLVETLFALPGLGTLFVRSLSERDYPLILVLVLNFTLVLQFGHWLSDLVLAKLGSRLSNESRLVA